MLSNAGHRRTWKASAGGEEFTIVNWKVTGVTFQMPANSWSAPANATSFCKITIKINENTPILTEQLKVDDLHTDCVKFEFIETILE